jgi:hypothetical protein
VPHADKWLLWCQSPLGFYMLLAGGWASRRRAEQVGRAFGYRIIAAKGGIAALEQQMVERADLGHPIRTLN